MSNFPCGYNEQESLDDHLERLNRYIDDAYGLLLWSLYHHQGSSSTIGQPIRKLLGIGYNDKLTEDQIKKAQISGGIYYEQSTPQ